MVTRLSKGKDAKPVAASHDPIDEGTDLVSSLQTKLDDAVIKIGDLTEVLKHLSADFSADQHNDETTHKAVDAGLTAASVTHGGASLFKSKTSGGQT